MLNESFTLWENMVLKYGMTQRQKWLLKRGFKRKNGLDTYRDWCWKDYKDKSKERREKDTKTKLENEWWKCPG